MLTTWLSAPTICKEIYSKGQRSRLNKGVRSWSKHIILITYDTLIFQKNISLNIMNSWKFSKILKLFAIRHMTMARKPIPASSHKNPDCESRRKIFHLTSKLLPRLGRWRCRPCFMGARYSHMVPAFMDSTFSWHYHAEHGTNSELRGFPTGF